MKKPLNPTWELDSIFPGGSKSPQLTQHLLEVTEAITALAPQVEDLKQTSPINQWSQVLEQIENIIIKHRQASAFVYCLTAQDVNDNQAKILSGRMRQIGASFQSILTDLDDILKLFPEDMWEKLLAQPELNELQFILRERRTRAKNRLCAHRESLANDLAIDGYHAWNDLYNLVVGSMQIEIEREGKTKTLSIGQADNLLSDANRELRQQVFAKYEAAWADQEDLLSTSLNHLAGFRLNLYRHRKWDDVLQEPLDLNRMSRDTLDAMWDTVQQNKAKVVEYLNRKAQLLDLDQLDWYDVDAPLGNTQTKISYEQGADFIVTQFSKFDPQLADFAANAFKARWIEAEDRPGKRSGGFCTSFPGLEESRIFMTYSGSQSNVSTLAHELGHAYHSHVLQGLSPLNRSYAMNVAETASTFGELLVTDAAIQNATSQKERLVLLEDKIQRSVAFFMNIHARFLFEQEFYARRKEGLVSPEELNQLMTAAQKQAYANSLGQYHPYFWASKLHFHITGTPFYNFPYTFGYLFSQGLYARGKAEGPKFAANYRNLLGDTGRMTVEDLAQKHLGVDLTKPNFWQEAVKLSLVDIEEFLRLTKQD